MEVRKPSGRPLGQCKQVVVAAATAMVRGGGREKWLIPKYKSKW